MPAETNAEDICASLEGKVGVRVSRCRSPTPMKVKSFGLIWSRHIVKMYALMSRKGVLAL